MSSLAAAGLDPAAVRERNPRLVFVAISGYGHSGPKAGRGGYDVIAQGEAGLMALTGPPEGGPSRFPTPMADISAGLYAAIGTLAALYRRDRAVGGSDRGEFLDVALVDAQMTWLANLAGSYFVSGKTPARLGNAHPTVTPYQPIRARDKLMIVAVGNDRLWERFCSVLGAEDLRRDPRFASNAERNRNRSALIPLLEEALAERDAADWTEKLVAAGVPAGPINLPDEALNDPHIAARKLIVEIEHPLLGQVRSIALPAHFAGGGIAYRRHPPMLGEHNEEIRAELGGVER
jgi:crotonobetainyl-CoA:carnitine CoA-transferase CaiB-like acyl-CoA transferase